MGFRQKGCWPARLVPKHRGDAPAAPGGAAWRPLLPGFPSPPLWPPPLRQTGGTPWGPAAPGPPLLLCFVASPWWLRARAAHGFASTCLKRKKIEVIGTPRQQGLSNVPGGEGMGSAAYFASHSATALLSTDWAFPWPSFGSSLFRREKGCLGQ